MTNYHPTIDMLTAYTKGELPASLSIAINIHSQNCDECKHHIQQLTQSYADQAFNHLTESMPAFNDYKAFDLQVPSNDLAFGGDITSMDLDFGTSDEFKDMFSTITSKEDKQINATAELKSTKEKILRVKNDDYVLPSVLNNIEQGKWTHLGKISRLPLVLDEGPIHTHLLRIEPNGQIPEHTHKGFELTLLLDGEFQDETGTYVKGDFICLDSAHKHSPKTSEGCLCLTVVNDALQFTKGMSKLLNPFGNLIY